MAEPLVVLGLQVGGAFVDAAGRGLSDWYDEKQRKKKEKKRMEKGEEEHRPQARQNASPAAPRKDPHPPDPHPSFSGYFVKEGHRVRTWKKRRFELKGTTVSYFKENSDHARGTIELRKSRAYITRRKAGREYGDRKCVVIEDKRNSKTFYFFPYGDDKAAAEEQIQAWLDFVKMSGGGVGLAV